MINKGIMSSNTDMWSTPQWLFNILDSYYKFNLDVCAVPENAKCRRFFPPEEDGLSKKWIGACWMNPPYGREIGKWVKKAYESSLEGAIVVALLPARTDTAWFWDYIYTKEMKYEFIRGRLKFNEGKGSAPFPSMIIIFENKYLPPWEEGAQKLFNYACKEIRESKRHA